MKVKKINKFLSVSTILCLASLTFFGVLANNNITKTNSDHQIANNSLKAASSTNRFIDQRSNSIKIENRDFNLLYDKSFFTIANTNEGMVGYDKTNKKLVLTGWDGNIIWTKSFYSSDFNPNNVEVNINSIIYNENSHQLALLFAKQGDNSIYFNLVDATKNSSNNFQQKEIISNLNQSDNNFEQWKLTKSYNDNSYLVFYQRSDKNNFIDYLDHRNGTTFIIETSQTDFLITKVLVNKKHSDPQNKDFARLLNIRKINQNHKSFFIASFIIQQNSTYKLKIVLLDELFNPLQTKEISLESFSLSNNSWYSQCYFLIENNLNDTLKISFVFINNNYNYFMIFGTLNLDLNNTTFTNPKYIKFNKNNNHNINIQTISFNEKEKYISGFIKKAENGNNNIFSFSTTIFDKLNEGDNSSSYNLDRFLNLNGVNTKFESQNYEKAAVINWNKNVYYTYLDNSSNSVYYIKMKYSDANTYLNLAWNTTFASETLVWKNATKYAKQYSDEQYSEFLIENLIDKTDSTKVSIFSKTISQSNDASILNNTLEQEEVTITYALSYFYEDGNFTYFNSAMRKSVKILFLYDRANTAKINNLKLSNSALAQETDFKNVFVRNENVDIYVHADVEAIEQNELAYFWYKKNSNTQNFELITNQNRNNLHFNSFSKEDDSEYKVRVEYQSLKDANNRNIIFKEKVFKLSLDMSRMQKIELVTITSLDSKPVIGKSYQLTAQTFFKFPNQDTNVRYEWLFSKDLETWTNIANANRQSNILKIENFTQQLIGYYKVKVIAVNKDLFITPSYESNIIHLSADNNKSVSIVALNLQSKTESGKIIDFLKINKNTYEIYSIKDEFAIIDVILSKSNNENESNKKEILDWEFGCLDQKQQLIWKTSGVYNSSDKNNNSIKIKFSLDQKNQLQYYFKLFQNKKLIDSYNITINFKDYNPVEGKLVLKNNFSNNAIPFGSDVYLSFSSNDTFLSTNYDWFKWYKKNLSNDDQEMAISNEMYDISKTLKLPSFSFKNEGQYFLKGFANNYETIISDSIILLTEKPKVSVNTEKLNEVVSVFKQASSITTDDIDKILNKNIDLTRFEIVDYRLIANDFEGTLVIVPKIKELDSSLATNELRSSTIIELNQITISGFFSLKWLLVSFLIIIIVAVLILTIIIVYLKSRKYQKPRVEIKEELVNIEKYLAKEPGYHPVQNQQKPFYPAPKTQNFKPNNLPKKPSVDRISVVKK